MNQDVWEGRWKQVKGKVKAAWGELTDDEIDKTEGNSDQLAGLLQERYGLSKEEAKKQIDQL